MIRAVLLSALLAALGGCGFTPVYGPELANSGAISIPEIRGRTGHFLRQELLRTVGQGVPGIKGAGELDVQLDRVDRKPRLRARPGRIAKRLSRYGEMDAC